MRPAADREGAWANGTVTIQTGRCELRQRREMRETRTIGDRLPAASGRLWLRAATGSDLGG